MSGLPAAHRDALICHQPQRLALVHHYMTLVDDTCIPITLDELLCAVRPGKSTAPGQDGLTYDILYPLLALPDNPILDLFNMSYSSSTLPLSWKSALIIPIPKSDGTFRPISLTSCLCKLMERVILQRLIYKVGDLMSPNLYGFMKGRCTANCFVKCLSNTTVTCRAFVDLKGAFDRANKDVIMEELVMKGVKGKLLGWIREYLYNRKAKVWFQGAVSSEASFDLGTQSLAPCYSISLWIKLPGTPFHRALTL